MKARATAGAWSVGEEYIGGLPIYHGDVHVVTVRRVDGLKAERIAAVIAAALNGARGLGAITP
jgi:hypothetical protein